MTNISIIVPVYNEEGNLDLLFESITSVMNGQSEAYEIIAVNDGSTDNSKDVLAACAERFKRLIVINFSRNYGQTAAMQAALDHSRGEIIVPLDADLQNDPKDIPRLLAKLDEGYDVVSGWRKNRKDNPFVRNFPSRMANKIISRVSRVHLHDYGCSLKAYRREVISQVRLYGEMHRFIPIYASWYGNRITEIPVEHHERHAGQSNYGLERVVKVVLDLWVVKFLHGPMMNPMHWFGGVGLCFWMIAIGAGGAAIWLRVTGFASFIETPLPLVVVMGLMMGMMCLLVGLLAEMQMRIYFENQDRRTYSVASIIGDKDKP